MGLNRRRPAVGVGVAVALALVLAVSSGPAVRRAHAGPPCPCLAAGQVTQNCNLDTFTEQVDNGKSLAIPSGWWYFVLEGAPDYRPSHETGNGPGYGPPGLQLVSDGVPYTAGIYQQVQVTPGVVYKADIGWFPVGSTSGYVADFERKVGLDPAGGANPLAETVLWSRTEGDVTNKWPDLTVSARATGSTMTVFVWVRHWISHGADSAYLDAIGLWPDPSQPAATATLMATATPTARPPTRTPRPATPTLTAQPATPTVAASVPTTETAVPMPSPTWTLTPSPAPLTATSLPTSTPTAEPTHTAIAVARAKEAASPQAAEGTGSTVRRQKGAERALLYVVTAAMVGAIGLGGTGLGVWVRTSRKNKELDENR
jgi:hypothetical protein